MLLIEYELILEFVFYFECFYGVIVMWFFVDEIGRIVFIDFFVVLCDDIVFILIGYVNNEIGMV